MSFESQAVYNPAVSFTLASVQLINAYVIQNTRLSNIKAVYVNYFTQTSAINSGDYIPTMLRIGGAVFSS